MADQVITTQLKASDEQASTTILDLSKKLDGLVKSAGSAAKAVYNFSKTLVSAALGTGKFSSGLTKVLDAFKRIVFYRAIRSAIREVTQGFKEGVNNLYQYSLALRNIDAAHAVGTMNELATVSLYVKNSLGAALMPILESLVPLVNAVANAFVTAANAVNQFFQALKGNTVFTKAKKYAVDYADGLKQASGAAKELKKQVFGFDELNIFNEPSSGGGGGGSGLDYSQMFEEAQVSDFMENIKALMDLGLYRTAGEKIAEGLNEIVKSFDAAGFGKKLGTKIRNGLQLAVGFVTSFNFTQLGSKVAELLNNLFYQVNFEDIGTFLARKLTAIIDFAIGFVTTFDFGYAAESISKVIVGIFDHLSDWLLQVDWESFGNTFFNQVYDFVTGIDFGAIFSSFFSLVGVAMSEALLLFRGFTDGLIAKVSEYFKTKMDEAGGDVVLGLYLGIKDAIVGVGQWIYNNVILPLIGGFAKGLGFGTEGATMKEIGKEVITGFFEGLKAAWQQVATWVSTKAQAIKDTFNNIIRGIKNFRMDSPRYLDYGVSAGLFAEGGQPKQGTLFWAGEAGAELVGQVGGRTTVTTHDQFSEGMANIMDGTNSVIMQAASALIQAIQNKDMTSIVTIGDRDIVSSYDRGKRLAGASLVE